MDHHEIATLARRQHGLISHEQLAASRHAITNALATGRLERVRRGVYRIAGAPTTWEQQVMAAVLAISRSRASHRCAARLHGLEGFDNSPVEVTVRSRQHARRDGVVVHETAIIGPLHGAIVRGIPCMSVARTLCDLTAILEAEEVERTVDEALRRRLVTIHRLAAVFDDLDHAGRRRSTVMRAVLERRTGAGESHPEVRVARLLIAAGLPAPVHQHQMVVGGRRIRIDLAYPELRIAIEYDGWAFHSTRRAFDRDRARANELELLGWTVLRFTSASSDRAVVDTVRSALARATAS